MRSARHRGDTAPRRGRVPLFLPASLVLDALVSEYLWQGGPVTLRAIERHLGRRWGLEDWTPTRGVRRRLVRKLRALARRRLAAVVTRPDGGMCWTTTPAGREKHRRGWEERR